MEAATNGGGKSLLNEIKYSWWDKWEFICLNYREVSGHLSS